MTRLKDLFSDTRMGRYLRTRLLLAFLVIFLTLKRFGLVKEGMEDLGSLANLLTLHAFLIAGLLKPEES